jgi:hypothetical protein
MYAGPFFWPIAPGNTQRTAVDLRERYGGFTPGKYDVPYSYKYTYSVDGRKPVIGNATGRLRFSIVDDNAVAD